MIATMLGASIGVPYVASRAQKSMNAPAAPSAAAPMAHASAPSSPIPPMLATTPPAAISTPHTVGTTPAITTIQRSPSAEQALQFNVTKEWVYQSWDRKSTGPTDVGLFAVRVPLVSGTQAASLAGSLTYYFNAQNQVEHISFRGRTGDPARLIHFLMRTYQLEPASSPTGEQVYQVADRSGTQSELIVRPESIVNGRSGHGGYSVELELARPGSERYLPSRQPNLNIPQTPDVVAAQQAAAEAAAANPEQAAAANSSYFDKVRYATPQEEGQLFWKRWPN